jgi:sugar phosphate isomerase/epimerase
MMSMTGEDYSTLESIRATGGVVPDATWPDNRRRARSLAALAAREGVPLVTFHAGFIPHDESDPRRAALLDRLREMCGIFGEAGVEVAFETGQETAETLVEALGAIGRGNLGVNFDPANMILYGMGDPVAALRRLAPAVRQVHVKDALPATTPGMWGTEVPAGKGAVPWDDFFEVALALPREVDFIIEREAGPNRLEDVAQARDMVARRLEGARAT